MASEITSKTNVKQAVPFFNVKNMEAALQFYREGLGFEMKDQWIDEGKLRWCLLRVKQLASVRRLRPCPSCHRAPWPADARAVRGP